MIILLIILSISTICSGHTRDSWSVATSWRGTPPTKSHTEAETRKPIIDDGNDEVPGSGNDLILPMPAKDPSLPEPRDIFDYYKYSVFEVTSENEHLYNVLNLFLTETYGSQLPHRRLVNHKSLDESKAQLAYQILPGQSYTIDLTNISDWLWLESVRCVLPSRSGRLLSLFPFNCSRHDQNPFYFGSFDDLKIHVEVWENLNPVGLRDSVGIYRRLILRGRKETLEALIRLSHEYAQPPKIKNSHIPVYTNNDGDWDYPTAVPKRPLSTVYLAEGLRDSIVKDLASFYHSKDLYEQYSIPYRRNYLLAGPPGSGKTTLIRALASEWNKSIGVLQFSDSFGQHELMQALRSFPGDFLVIEDVNSLYVGRENNPKQNGLSFRDFINVIDGLCSREGIVLFMTTNDPVQLDPALIRSGRVDFRITFRRITKSQVAEMFMAFFPKQEEHFDEFYQKLSLGMETSIADLQEFFFRHLGCSNILLYVDELAHDND